MYVHMFRINSIIARQICKISPVVESRSNIGQVALPYDVMRVGSEVKCWAGWRTGQGDERRRSQKILTVLVKFKNQTMR